MIYSNNTKRYRNSVRIDVEVISAETAKITEG